jgi:threonine synthase
MNYISTRDNCAPESSSVVILKGMVPQGGLFVPEYIPKFSYEAALHRPYAALAGDILKLFLDDYAPEDLDAFCASAYGRDKFDDEHVVPLKHLDAKSSVLELWHGPTAAFKDVALQLLPYLLCSAAKKNNISHEIVILVATSGDTGKAALEGFKDIPGTRIIVFYPEDGVSDVQKMQMLTTAGSNTAVVGLKGNFDDCQNMVKDIFADEAFAARMDAAGFMLSSANSINWGRLVPQIVYYYSSYARMVEEGRIKAGDALNYVVPTGNFGNILAAWYAGQMGLPLGKLICASNKNRILHDFFTTGVYDTNRDFFPTDSPSMDILVSSNLERFLFHLAGPEAVQGWYRDLAAHKRFSTGSEITNKMAGLISASSADEEQTRAAIAGVYANYGYLIDPHTAVAACVYRQYQDETKDPRPAVIDATASPFKFNKAVYGALYGSTAEDEFSLIQSLAEKSGTGAHRSLLGLNELPVRHSLCVRASEGRETVCSLLGVE